MGTCTFILRSDSRNDTSTRYNLEKIDGRFDLNKFRDLKISREELYQSLPKNVAKMSIETPVMVCSEHVIGLLDGYKNGFETKETILEWVNTIWFSGWFEYFEEQCDSITSIMNCLEEIDEEDNELTSEKVEIYLNALKHNIEID